MASEIEVRDGVASMMYAGETPWHGLGTKVETEVTAGAAIKLAGLDWKCEKRPVFIQGKNVVDDIPVIGGEVKGLQAVVRTEDDAILGMVSPGYHIIQNHECFEFLDEIIGSGQAVFHTAGSLFGGKVIFCTVKFPDDAKIGDDVIHKYLLLFSSHDRKHALTAFWTPVRVVCSNTMNVATHNQSRGKSVSGHVSIRHVAGYKNKIEQARNILELNAYYYQVMEEQFNRLLDQQFSSGNMEEFSETMFPVKKSSKGNKLAGVTRKKREVLSGLFSDGKGNKSVTGTKWAAFNAVTEYVDHHLNVRPPAGFSKEEARMNSISFGNGSNLKQRAFDLLTV